MSVHREWWLVCDRCGTEGPKRLSPETKVSDGLALFGWRRTLLKGGKVEDACPECQR